MIAVFYHWHYLPGVISDRDVTNFVLAFDSMRICEYWLLFSYL